VQNDIIKLYVRQECTEKIFKNYKNLMYYNYVS